MASVRQIDEGGPKTDVGLAYDAGRRALANADWDAAYTAFRDVVAAQPDHAGAWEGLAEASYWTPDEDAVLQARERAYNIHRETGDSLSSARMAGWLAIDWFELRGQYAVSNGWLRRARRLVRGHTETPEGAWVTLAEARLTFMRGEDPAAACRMAARAAGRARRSGLADLEALSLSLEGLAWLSVGEVRRAVQRLDEASVIVLGGEAEDVTFAALTLCQLMAACERTRDFDRARQWCATAKQYSEDRGFPVLLSICRPHYGAVLMWRGHWPEAEEHLLKGSRELMEFLPPFATGALSLLASLRWRQGKWDEAEELFERIRGEPAAQLGLAEMAAARGELEVAIETAERRLRSISKSDALERGPILELLTRCRAAAGEVRASRANLRELRSIADAVGTPSLQASAALAEGELAIASDRPDVAHPLIGDAVALFETAGAPFESARARVTLAETLVAVGRLDMAAREAYIAGESFRRIGALGEADRAARLLASIDARRKKAAGRDVDILTTREREVLELLAQGQSNQEIAERLVLSVRTVERHASNIYQKLELEGPTARTAAAAYAHRTDGRTAGPAPRE
jgi:ATP/maltotriose-dependent transcriptional regulator MalT